MISDKGITIERVFDTPRQKVWDAVTKPDQVKAWWGPKDFYSPSIKIDFRVGGRYIYCMRGPKNSPWDKDLYSAGVYREIVPLEKLVVSDYSSDKDGHKASPTEHGLMTDMPAEMNVTFYFKELSPTKTRLIIEYPRPASDKAFAAMKESRMEDGWGTSLDKLAALLQA